MKSGFCPRCREYRVFSVDNCLCVEFHVWLTETGDQAGMDEEAGRSIYAHDAEDAAEAFCAQYDREDGEYGIINDSSAYVMVRGSDGDVTQFLVEAYPEPVYRARARV